MDKRTKILLVEDNQSDIELTRRAFERSGFSGDLIVAEDGQEAIDYLLGARGSEGRDFPELPTLTLLDLKLPKISGLEVLREIRSGERTRRIPVVILTSSNEEPDRAAGYDLGVNSYVRKPVDFTELVFVVEQMGRYWLSLNQQPPEVR